MYDSTTYPKIGRSSNLNPPFNREVALMKKIVANLRSLAVVIFIGLVVSFAVVFFPASGKAQIPAIQNHVVTLDQAVKYIQNYKKNPVAPSTKGGYFGRNIFDKILAQQGVVGIRYYYAAKDDSTPTLVLVGVDSTGNDMVRGVVGEWINSCPPFCGSTNQLSK